jgi:Zn-dependent M28 family amino/carboxypeptidase
MISSAKLSEDVRMLSDVIGERNILHPKELDAAANFLDQSLRKAGYAVKRQTYEVDGMPCHNLEAELAGSNEIVVVGGHYDSVFGSPGANDNATGAAAVLALAREFAGQRPGRTLRFVEFVNEEPPYFQTEQMGSLVYARACKARGENIVGMLSLETMGFYSDAPGSQKYPFPFNWLFPSVGNFIGLVANRASKRLLTRLVEAYASSVPCQSVSTFESIPGIGWSDQWSFWQVGYPGVMVTDTAPFRYPHYHTALDTPDKIDYGCLAQVVQGLAGALNRICLTDPIL